MMYRRRLAGLASLFALAGCGAASVNPTATQSAPQQVRQRPRRRVVQRVLGDAVQRASECLPRAAGTIVVTGSFRGETGAFRVENIEAVAPLGTSARTCVREEFESAHVENFADERYHAMRSFGPDGVVIGAQNGNAPASVASTASSSPPPQRTTTTTTTTTTSSSTPESVFASSSSPGLTAASSPAVPGGTRAVASHSGAPAGLGVAHTQSGAPASGAPGTRATATTTPTHVATDAGPLPARAIAGCYQTVARANPAVGGRVRLRLEVTPDGVARGVNTVTLGSPTGPLPLFNSAARCIEQRTRAFAFPHSAAGAHDLVVTLVPGPNGGTVSIARRSGGLTNSAPGLDADGTASEDSPAGGTFDEQIASTVRGRVGEIRACYQTQLARSADLQLRTLVRFTIEPAGRVAAASSTTVVLAGEPDAATSVAQCVEGLVRGTVFPGRAVGTAVETSLPFSFTPGAGTSATTAGGVDRAATGATNPANVAATGHIDAARTGAVIRANTDRIRACYTRALQDHPDLSGRVLVRFTVDLAGRVIAPGSQVTTLTGDRNALASVASCIEAALVTLTLPPPSDGPAAVALPFDFSPSVQ